MINAEQARDAVHKDVEGALGQQLPDGDGWRLDDAFTTWEQDPMTDDGATTVAVPWMWHGVNKGLLGLAATDREVTLRGITVVTEDGQDLLCQRYVDWLPALQQAGIVLFSRPIVTSQREFDPQALLDDPDLAGVVEEVAALRAGLDP